MSRYAKTMVTFDAGAPPSLPTSTQAAPPWTVPNVPVFDSIAHLQANNYVPAVVAYSLSLEPIIQSYLDSLKVYTNRSVHHDPATSAAAFVILEIGRLGRAKLTPLVSSTTAELVATQHALHVLTSLPPSTSTDPHSLTTRSSTASQTFVRIFHHNPSPLSGDRAETQGI